MAGAFSGPFAGIALAPMRPSAAASRAGLTTTGAAWGPSVLDTLDTTGDGLLDTVGLVVTYTRYVSAGLARYVSADLT